jgi:hypothetical protein
MLKLLGFFNENISTGLLIFKYYFYLVRNPY